MKHKTFSIKADYIRKINYSAPNEASENKAAKPAKEAKQLPRNLEAALRSAFAMSSEKLSGSHCGAL